MWKLLIFLPLVVILLFTQIAFGQVNCSGTQIFSAKNCSGDEVSAEETKLLQIINEYRTQNKLLQISSSRALSVVAHRHLLDLQRNFKELTHSWSDCLYNVKDEKSWNCVTDAPKRLNIEFKGQSYENLYRNLNGNAAPLLALEAWKKSDLHNSLILNLGVWNTKPWDSIGVAINGQYAAIWFGSSDSGAVLSSKSVKGLGLGFQEVVKNIENLVAIEKTSIVTGKDIWVGKSKDKSIILELLGTPEDIERVGFSIKIKLDTQKSLTVKNRELLLVFVNNIFPNSSDAEKWLDSNIAKIIDDPKSTQNWIKDGKVIQIRRDTSNYLVLTAKPYKKTSAIEF